MESISIRQRLRPVRYAFVIPPDDASAFLTAASINTVLWGGIYNLIIPVESEFVLEAALAQFDPDCLIDLTDGSLLKSVRSSEEFVHRIIGRGDLVHDAAHRTSGRGGRHLKIGFGIGNVLRAIRENELREATESRAALVSVAPSMQDGWTLYAAATFGSFSALPQVPPELDATAYYRKLLLAKDVLFDAATDLDYGEWIFPIAVTKHGLRRFGGVTPGRSSHILYVGDRTNVVDLAEFWNLRATGREVWFVPHDSYEFQKRIVLRVASEGRYPINPQVENHPDVCRSKNVTPDKFEKFIEWLRTISIDKFVIHDTPAISDKRVEAYIRSSVAACEIQAAEGEDRSLLDGERMTPIKLIEPPNVDDEMEYGENTWAVELAMTNPYSSRDWICKVPRFPGANAIVRRQIIGGRWESVRIGRHGVVMTVEHLNETVYILPLRPTEVFETLFKNATGLEPSPSQPGRYAAQIIKKMGDLQFDCRLFKLRGVREIINRLGNGSTLTRGNMYDIVTNTKPDSFGQNWREDLYKHLVIVRGGGGTDFSSIFNELLNRRVIRPGMIFSCTHCNSTAWYHVSEFGEDFGCRFCFERQRVPFGSKTEWHYKADGLFQVPNSAEGSLSAILALWRLDEAVHSHNGIYSTAMNFSGLKGQCVAEIDFAYLAMKFNTTSYDLVLGEAKGYMDYDRDKLAALAALADKFQPVPFLAVATLKDAFSDAEKALIREYASKGYRMIPLTRLELDPYYLYDRFANAPTKHIVSLSGLEESAMFVNVGR